MLKDEQDLSHNGGGVSSPLKTWSDFLTGQYDQNYKKYDRLELSILLLRQKTTPTVTGLKYPNGRFLRIKAL